MSLRARLSLGLVVLAAFGLAAAGVATYSTLRSYLYDRVDKQLASEIWRPIDPNRPQIPRGAYLQARDASGDVLATVNFVDAPIPDLSGIESGYETVSATDGSTKFRVLVAQNARGAVRVYALPLDDIQRTLARLLVTELIVAAAVLAALAALGWWFVHRELRPLEAMGDTAGAIAAGDLTRRVDTANEETEVGRLGIALNAMLTQIEQAFAEREESESRLRRFVADASHELRTPLTSIRGYSELFRRGADQRPEDLAKAMRRIEEEAARMGVLVDDLLLLARLDQGRELEHAPVELTRLAEDAVSDARTVAPDHTFSFTPNGPLTVVGDEARLRQVLANLVSNAYTHTPEGTNVGVRVEAVDGDAVIEVTDNGPGLALADAANAFDRFWRADTARTRERGGVGLGLAIVSAIAQAHGGDASVESEPGSGATFRVRLPLAP